MANSQLLIRCLFLGAAAGLRSSWGLAGPVLASGTDTSRVAVASAALGEALADKHPSVPDRLSALGLPPRLLSGATGALLLARRDRSPATLPMLTGAVGALLGAVAGRSYRSWAGQRRPDWQAALGEDALAAALALTASRRGG